MFALACFAASAPTMTPDHPRNRLTTRAITYLCACSILLTRPDALAWSIARSKTAIPCPLGPVAKIWVVRVRFNGDCWRRVDAVRGAPCGDVANAAAWGLKFKNVGRSGEGRSASQPLPIRVGGHVCCGPHIFGNARGNACDREFGRKHRARFALRCICGNVASLVVRRAGKKAMPKKNVFCET
jgi:hypothetical protein